MHSWIAFDRKYSLNEISFELTKVLLYIYKVLPYPSPWVRFCLDVHSKLEREQILLLTGNSQPQVL